MLIISLILTTISNIWILIAFIYMVNICRFTFLSSIYLLFYFSLKYSPDDGQEIGRNVDNLYDVLIHIPQLAIIPQQNNILYNLN